MNPTVIVSCGKSKRPVPSPAGRLYTGPFVTSALRWARSVTTIDRIFVLSAKYGLVAHDEVIAPYELTLGQPGAVTTDTLRSQAAQRGLLAEPVVVVGGARYVQAIRVAWNDPARVRVPFGRERGHHGQGQMMRAMKLSEGAIP